jgi:cytoskeleton protein RodZ
LAIWPGVHHSVVSTESRELTCQLLPRKSKITVSTYPNGVYVPSFGEKLKLEREKKKMTLEDISATTKISTRMLHALEDEKFSQLPGGIFNKGFVRAYARTVGLDEDQTIADYLEASGEAPPPRPEPGIRDNARDNIREIPSRIAPLRITDEPSGRLEIRAEVASRQIPWGVFAVILLIIALALSLWTNRRRQQEREATHPSRPAQQEQLQPTSDASPPSEATGATGSQSTSISPPADSSLPASQAPASTAVHSASEIAPEKSAVGSGQPSESLSAPLAPGEFAVTVRAREESWVSISIDGKHTGSEVLEPGDERTFRARTDVVLKAGNSGGVDLLLNGKPLAFTGEQDVVKIITVGPSGIVIAPLTTPTQ